MKIKIVNEDNALLLEVNPDSFKKDEVVILNLNNTVKDIAIGFAKYYRDSGGNDKIIIVDSLVFTEFRTNEYLFNEYLNTLK